MLLTMCNVHAYDQDFENPIATYKQLDIIMHIRIHASETYVDYHVVSYICV